MTLLHDHAAGLLQLVRSRGGGDVHHLSQALLELVEVQRAVVQGRGQAEAVLDQRRLALTVAVVHPAHLGDALVALVDDHQRVLGQVVQERGRRLPRGPPREMPRVVLDAVAVADLAQHLQVEHRALEEALGLQQLALSLELGLLLQQLGLDAADGVLHLRPRRDVVARRIDRHLGQLAQGLAGQRIERRDGLHLVPEQLDADAGLLVGGGRSR
jgi:hypothetical protein